MKKGFEEKMEVAGDKAADMVIDQLGSQEFDVGKINAAIRVMSLKTRLMHLDHMKSRDKASLTLRFARMLADPQVRQEYITRSLPQSDVKLLSRPADTKKKK